MEFLRLPIIAVSMFFVSTSIYAEPNIQTFTSDELKVVREASQAILQARGKKRQEIMRETKELRDAINEVRGILEQLNRASILPAHVLNDSNQLTLAGKGTGNAVSTAANQDALRKRDEAFVAKVSKAKNLINTQKQSIAKQLPNAKATWNQADKAKDRVKHILSRLEVDLADLSGADRSQRAGKIQSILNKLNSGKKVKTDTKPEPTITTITKHYKK